MVLGSSGHFMATEFVCFGCAMISGGCSDRYFVQVWDFFLGFLVVRAMEIVLLDNDFFVAFGHRRASFVGLRTRRSRSGQSQGKYL